MSSKYYRDMSPEEQREYRRKRRMRRKIKVLFNYFLVVLGILLLIILFSKFLSKDTKTSKQVENKPEDHTINYELKVSKKDKHKTTKVESADSKKKKKKKKEENLSFAANETDSTVSINLESVESPYAILINSNTSEIVASKNPKEKIYPASMTKIMTVYTASKHLSAEDLSKKVEISHEAVDYAYANDCSTSGFIEGEQVTVKDLFYGTIGPSGGDAAVQLAMYVGKDLDTFVTMMNTEVKKLGLAESTHFTNPVGIYDDANYSTVYDMAIILEAAMSDDVCKDVLSTKVYNSEPTNLNPEGITISNWFLRRIEDKDFGGEILGAKTGFVDQSKSCAASCELSDNKNTYYCVTAGASSSWSCINNHVEIYKNYAK